MKDELIRAALLGAGCHDADAALKIGDFSGVKLAGVGNVDAASVAAAVGAFRVAKPYLFGTSSKEPAVEPVTAKSALDMSAREYRTSKFRLVSDGVVSRTRSKVDLGEKSAMEMSDEEYAAARRRAGLGSPLRPGRSGKENWTERPSKPSTKAPTPAATVMARVPGKGPELEPTWGGLQLRNRSSGPKQSLAPGRS